MSNPFRDPPPPDGLDGPRPEPPEAGKAASRGPDTAVLPRNFTLTSEERIRAIVAGPPAFVRRKRAIEDLEAQIAGDLVARDAADDEDRPRVERRIEAKLQKLHRLVADHNRYYPIEANLPMDPRTGLVVERGGVPWRPLPTPTLEALRDRAR